MLASRSIFNRIGVQTGDQVVNPKYTQVSGASLSSSDRVPINAPEPHKSHCLAPIKPDLDIHHGG